MEEFAPSPPPLKVRRRKRMEVEPRGNANDAACPWGCFNVSFLKLYAGLMEIQTILVFSGARRAISGRLDPVKSRPQYGRVSQKSVSSVAIWQDGKHDQIARVSVKSSMS